MKGRNKKLRLGNKRVKLHSKLVDRLPNKIMKTYEKIEENIKCKLQKENISRNLKRNIVKTVKIKQSFKLKYYPLKKTEVNL